MGLAKGILRVFGWKVQEGFPQHKKMVIIAAPHTSFTDFLLGYLGYRALGVRPKIIIKKEFFFFPLGYLLKAIGAISVDRGNKSNNMLAQLKAEFDKRDSFQLSITPEGSRKLVRRWKKGFYLLVMETKVPLVIGFIDYQKKLMGAFGEYKPTGDYDNDILEIRAFYSKSMARYPDLFYEEEKK